MKHIHSISSEDRPRLGMRHLLMISAVARTGNLTRAAQDLGVTPSALSHRLGEAERRIDQKLCDREGRRVTLTPAGEMIRRAADQALGLVAQAESDVARLGSGLHDRALRMTVGHYGVYDWFPDFLCQWQLAHEKLHVYVRADAQRDPLAALREGLVDIAVLPYRPRTSDLVGHSLFNDELVLVCATGDLLATKEHIEPADLTGRDFLTYTRVVVPDQEYERFIRPTGARTDRWLDMEDLTAIVGLVERGRGVSILSRWAVSKALADGRIAARRITKTGLEIEWCAVTTPDVENDAQLAELVQALKTHFAAVPEEPLGK